MVDSASRGTSGLSDRAGRSDVLFLDRPRVRVGGVRFSVSTLDRAVTDFIRAASTRALAGQPVRLSNAYCVALAAADPSYGAVFQGSGVTLPDGAPLGWIVGLKTRATAERGGRVRGPSFFVRALDEGRSAGLRHFVLGASQTTLDSLEHQITEQFPGATVAGTWSPPYGPLSEAFYKQAVARVQESGADVLWLGLGTPKQDVAAAVLSQRLDVAVVGVGAAFDFFAGSVREAPPFLRDHGLEWVYRLFADPRRLWRRYLIGNLQFLAVVVADEIAVRRNRRSRA